jgi:hypothetical protein
MRSAGGGRRCIRGPQIVSGSRELRCSARLRSSNSAGSPAVRVLPGAAGPFGRGQRPGLCSNAGDSSHGLRLRCRSPRGARAGGERASARVGPRSAASGGGRRRAAASGHVRRAAGTAVEAVHSGIGSSQRSPCHPARPPARQERPQAQPHSRPLARSTSTCAQGEVPEEASRLGACVAEVRRRKRREAARAALLEGGPAAADAAPVAAAPPAAAAAPVLRPAGRGTVPPPGRPGTVHRSLVLPRARICLHSAVAGRAPRRGTWVGDWMPVERHACRRRARVLLHVPDRQQPGQWQSRASWRARLAAVAAGQPKAAARAAAGAAGEIAPGPAARGAASGPQAAGPRGAGRGQQAERPPGVSPGQQGLAEAAPEQQPARPPWAAVGEPAARPSLGEPDQQGVLPPGAAPGHEDGQPSMWDPQDPDGPARRRPVPRWPVLVPVFDMGSPRARADASVCPSTACAGHLPRLSTQTRSACGHDACLCRPL